MDFETFTLKQTRRIARMLDRRERDLRDRQHAQRMMSRAADDAGDWVLTVRGTGSGQHAGQRVIDGPPNIDKPNTEVAA